jgi:hypothetical protein
MADGVPADADPLGLERDGSQRHPGIDRLGHEGPRHVVPDEEPVPARLFGVPRQTRQGACVPEGTEVGEIDGELHPAPAPASSSITTNTCSAST